MQISRTYKPHNKVDYYILPNGKADVFLHRNEKTEVEVDEQENEYTVYVAEEVYFRTDSLTKEYIEGNFDAMWKKAENPMVKPTNEERIQALEDAMLDVVLGGMM